jgi:hypothetical protein
LGADPNLLNRVGLTPLHLACERRNSELIDLLLRFAASTKIPNFDGKLPFQMIADSQQQGQLQRWMNSILSFYISPSWAKHEPIITTDQRTSFRISFVNIDCQSMDGVLDQAELSSSLCKLLGHDQTTATPSQQMVLFQQWLDSDSDGKITFRDWFRWCGSWIAI